MGRPSIVPEIMATLEPWLDARMREWDAAPKAGRQPTLPFTDDCKVNVRALTLTLGLRLSQEQHFYRHPELTSIVNAAAEAQGLRPIGSRTQADAEDAVVRKRIARIHADHSDLARTLAEREGVIEAQRREIQSLREQLNLQDETGMTLRIGLPD